MLLFYLIFPLSLQSSVDKTHNPKNLRPKNLVPKNSLPKINPLYTSITSSLQKISFSPLKFRGKINDIKSYEKLFQTVIKKIISSDLLLKKVLVKFKQTIDYEDNNIVTLYQYWLNVDVNVIYKEIFMWLQYINDPIAFNLNYLNDCDNSRIDKQGDNLNNSLNKPGDLNGDYDKDKNDKNDINDKYDNNINNINTINTNDNININNNINNINTKNNLKSLVMKNVLDDENDTNEKLLQERKCKKYYESYNLLLQGCGTYDDTLYKWFVNEIMKSEKEDEEGMVNIFMGLVCLLRDLIY